MPAGYMVERNRATAEGEEGRAASTREAGVRRSLLRFPGKGGTEGGKEIQPGVSGRVAWWSRQRWFGSVRSGGALGLRRCREP